MEKNKISEWFDPCNMEHLKAYSFLEDNGFWPDNFILKDLKMDADWQYLIRFKMAEAWLNYKLHGKT